MPLKILAVQTDAQGNPVVVVAVAPGDIGMRAIRVDNGPRELFPRSATFPPAPGTWWRHETGGPIEVGCPVCEKPISLATMAVRVLEDGQLEPGLGCPHKGCTHSAQVEVGSRNAMITLADFQPLLGESCRTCSHAAHTAACSTRCACQDDGRAGEPIYKLVPIAEKRVVIAGERELQHEARRIAGEAVSRARRA